MLAEKDGVVFCSTRNGSVFVLDGATGAIRWQHKLGNGVVDPLVPPSTTAVLTTDSDGEVAVLEVAYRGMVRGAGLEPATPTVSR